MIPTVVINTFARPDSFNRLLRSLECCDAPDGTNVVISIDGGAQHPEPTRSLADGFHWTAGKVQVREQEDLGLVGHFRYCGDLTTEFGPVVLLEDDLVIGPQALRFAAAALEHTESDDRIAGVSLSLPWFDGFRHLPFEPMLDGTDTVFARLPWFHGMAWTPKQWARHRGGADVAQSTPLPPTFATLDADEWFPDAVRALVEHDHWFLLPRTAHALNFGEPGVHFDTTTSMFQQPLVHGTFAQPRLGTLDALDVVPYDEYLEPDPRWISARIDGLDGLDVTIDLRGLRPPKTITTEFVVTTRSTSAAIRSWGAQMHPLEQNLISNVTGTAISLARTEHLIDDNRSRRRSEFINVTHAFRGKPPGIRGALRRRLMRRQLAGVT